MKKKITVERLGGGYYAVFEGNSVEPKIVYRANEKVSFISNI